MSQQWDPGATVGKTALSTVIVIVTLFVVFCVLPCGLFMFLGVLGNAL
jgi:hypothetical protein